MYLKKIKIQGFKSFADSVNLDFESGITGVVGPNGSGKSNVGDAIRWVLGEQSIKTLRGNNMQDVIFSGTQKRKPLNFAEVSLILDNSSKALNIDYSEVNITRRIFRSGESEYYINKTACRLKDIRELFMDTGVGRDGYSIIGQGKIDEILSSKSEDRRKIFEEASGIMKHKTRKIESERKLEATKQNLLRIDDIISELHIQINPLKEQSEKAKKYLDLASTLKILDINIFIDSYRKLNQNIEFVKNDIIEIEKLYDECTVKLDGSDKAYNEFNLQNKEFENRINALNQEIFEIEKQFEKINSDISIANEKIANINSNKERISKENILSIEKRDCLQNEIGVRGNKYNELSLQFECQNNDIRIKESQILEINQTINQNLNIIEELKNEIIEKHNNVSNKKSSINNINVMLDNVSKRKKQINVESESLSHEIIGRDKQFEILMESIKESKKIIASLEKKSENNNSMKSSINIDIGIVNTKIDKTNEDLHKKTSKYNLLCDMDKEYQGFNKSVKSILKECQRSAKISNGVEGVLAQLISVPKKYEVAIEIALGGALQNIVTIDESSAKNVIKFLKENKLGRATFLPITSVTGRDFGNIKNELMGLNGVMGIGSELIDYDSKYHGIINNLLGKVLVVDTIENAIDISKKYKYSFKVVTLEGEVLMPGGSMSGGSTNNTTSILGRSREINELKIEIEELKNSLEKLLDQNKELSNQLNTILQDIEMCINNQRKAELELVGNEKELSQCSENIERINERLNVLNIEYSQLSEQLIDANTQIESINEEIQIIQSQISQITGETSLSQEQYNEQINMRDEYSKELTNVQISISGTKHEMNSINENIERINNEILEIDNQVNYNINLIHSIENEIIIQEEQINQKSERISQSKSLRDQKADILLKVISTKSDLQTDIEKIQKAWKDYNNELNEIADNRSLFEIKHAKYEMELEALQNRIWEEYELTISNSLQFEQDISQFGNHNKAIKDIKSQIQSLGNVNVNAIEEYVNIKERYDFLTAQKTDLEDAQKGLRKVINDMVKIMKEQFIEQFNIINDNFNIVFKELFGGGRADLVLLDEENVLDCGIEIEAQPPGKKLQNLSLLSGGERALTGIAILFAILKVRPTPFCVLDEIEAALDDVNVYRFAEYIKRFTKDTQFLIITHRKGTMEVADTIYGVTMQELGVSKMVSIKLEEVAI